MSSDKGRPSRVPPISGRLPFSKLPTSLLDDPNYSRQSPGAQLAFHHCCMLKAAGTLDRYINDRELDQMIASKLRLPVEHALKLRAELEGAKILDSYWQPLSWEDPDEPTGPGSAVSTKRVQKHREKAKLDT